MNEGTFELVLEGWRGFFPGEKGKGGCSHWQERPECRGHAETLRRVKAGHII